MNTQNCKSLQSAIDFLNKAKEIIEEIGEGEQEKFDNLFVHEGLQETEKGIKLEENASLLERYSGEVEGIIYEIDQIIES